MNTQNHHLEEGPLSTLIRESRPAPGLPPRFQENVWKRIERKEVPVSVGWTEALAALVLKPRFAVASVGALVLAGALFGTLEGTAHARQDAQERYVSSVAMTMAP